MVFRVIARLDIKPPNLVKGIHLEGFRKLGVPAEFATDYYLQGIDEIMYQDIVASLYERPGLAELVSETASEVFIPISVGGGIRTIEDAANMVRSGADKISLNTACLRNPEIINQIAQQLGSQAVTVAIEAKKLGSSWTAMTDSGREHTGVDVVEWASQLEGLGAGEVLLTSIDQDGTFSGPDYDLLDTVLAVTNLPVILHGGYLTAEQIVISAQQGASGVALASALHYKKITVDEIKQSLLKAGVEVRL